MKTELSKETKSNIADRIISLFHAYAIWGLVECSVEKVCDLLAEDVIGIGLG